MTTLKITSAYKKKLRELRKLHNTFIPNMNFNINDSLHTLFLPPSGDMVYLVSKNYKTLDEYPISEAYLATDETGSLTKVVLNSPFPNIWVVLEFDSFGGQIGYIASTDWVRNFKEVHDCVNEITSIGHKLYRLALTN